MAFRINFADLDPERQTSRIIITVGDVQVRSYPQTISDHFRDLEANRHFLTNRVLSSFFSGEEPLLNLNYIGSGTVNAFIFKDVNGKSERVTGDFLLDDALSHITKVLSELGAKLSNAGNDKEALLAQVAHDISLGIYDVYSCKKIGDRIMPPG